MGRKTENDLGRRDFLKSMGIAAGATSMIGMSADSAESSQTATPLTITFQLNNQSRTAQLDPRTTLVDLLRENLNLTGTKKGCDHGACGACTVHVNGNRVLACLTLAATLDGAQVTTIEGLGSDEQLHPMQEAFLRCDAYQCGYCTPGQIMSAVACIAEGHAQEDAEETREWMSGNLCRCSAYPNILTAVRQAAGVEPAEDPAARVKSMTLDEARK